MEESNKRNRAAARYPLAIRFLHFISGSSYFSTKLKSYFGNFKHYYFFSNKVKLLIYKQLTIIKINYFSYSFYMVLFDVF